MGDLGFNKIAAALLATGLGYMLLKEASHLVLHVEAPSTPAYALELPETGAGVADEKPLPFPQADWIAAMDVTKGEKVFKKCASCHNANNGGANGTGPNLWGTIGSTAGGKDGFKYSGALSASGIQWDFETLDGFLKKPSKYLKGTNMNFIGLKKAGDRAAVIAYLNAQSASPLPAPVAAIVETAEVMEAPKGEVMEKVGDVMEAPKGEIMEKVGDVIEAPKGEIMEKAGDIMEAPKGEVMEKVGEVIEAPKGDIMEKAGELIDEAKTELPKTNLKDKAKDALEKAVPDAVKDAAKDAGQ